MSWNPLGSRNSKYKEINKIDLEKERGKNSLQGPSGVHRARLVVHIQLCAKNQTPAFMARNLSCILAPLPARAGITEFLSDNLLMNTEILLTNPRGGDRFFTWILLVAWHSLPYKVAQSISTYCFDLSYHNLLIAHLRDPSVFMLCCTPLMKNTWFNSHANPME